MKKQITDKQAALLMFFAEYLDENDQLPPYYAMCHHFGWNSDNAALEMTLALYGKGYVERNANGKWRLTELARAFITERRQRARSTMTGGTVEPMNGNVYVSSAA